MPIYEYQCQRCEHKFESLQKISDEPLTDCPECHQSTLKKLISAAGFRLKGKGWYETDFKGGDKKKNIHGDAPTKKSDDKPKTKAKSDGGKKKSES